MGAKDEEKKNDKKTTTESFSLKMTQQGRNM
jgi:hypothetical protein